MWTLLCLTPAVASATAVADTAVTAAAPTADLDVFAGITIGASLALLLFATLGNLLLAWSTRQRAYGYYAVWAAMVPGWGLLETRLAMLLWPGLDPAWAGATADLFVVLAIAAAALGLRAALAPALPIWLLRAIDAATVALLMTGVANMLFERTLSAPHTPVLETITLIGVAMAGCACWWAWQRDAAREFAIAFTIPTAAMISTFDLPPLPLVPPEQGDFVVLGACALQALILMLVAARRLLRTAYERDTALSDGRRLAMLAELDPLTSLLNRRGFVSRAERLLTRPQGAALVLIDLDHFKAVNDHHGHDAGDDLLRAIAGVLYLAAEDGLVGRMGGEEFAVVLPSRHNVMHITERLRAAVADVQLGDVMVTASAGVAVPPPGATFPLAYRLADRALIAAKRQGRNRSVMASDDVAVTASTG